MNRYDVVKKLIEGELSEIEAGILMGLKSVRQVRRIKKKVIEQGAGSLAHINRGKPSNRSLKADFVKKAMDLIKERYSDFKPTFAAEKLWEKHHIMIGRETVRKLMITENLWKPKSRRSSKKHYSWRARKDNYGEMQQFDGSYHHWFEERGEECCLLLAVDDATGAITKAKMDKNEGTEAVFKFWLEYSAKHGFPLSIYLDKFSTYKINHPSAVDNKDLLTQFQRAMKQVGVNLITANSPEAKGRVERMNGTLQDRLVKELRLANVSTIEGANKFLKQYIPKFNKKFTVVPTNKADFHKKVSKELKKKLPQIFSVQSQRLVNNDYTVMYKNQFFQLGETQPTTVLKKDCVFIEEHLNGDTKIRLKDKYLNFVTLPKRPEKQINIPIIALTAAKTEYIPPPNHPWRGNKYLHAEPYSPKTSAAILSK